MNPSVAITNCMEVDQRDRKESSKSGFCSTSSGQIITSNLASHAYEKPSDESGFLGKKMNLYYVQISMPVFHTHRWYSLLPQAVDFKCP